MQIETELGRSLGATIVLVVASGLVVGLANASPVQAPTSSKAAEAAHARAVERLAQADAAGAAEAARAALEASALFAPEREMEVTPEKKLLFEEMIAEARSRYRTRRARYFLALGRALTELEQWETARRALRRSFELSPAVEPVMEMAGHPDLGTRERIENLLEGYFVPEADRGAIRQQLLATGAFADLDGLEALVDAARFRREIQPRIPELGVRVEPFPELRIVTDSGPFVAPDLLAQGMTLVLYFPASGCPRCSEELDGVRRAVAASRREGKEIGIATFVPDAELRATRRIARLLAMELEVGRRGSLPAELQGAEEEIHIVTRNGLLQFHLAIEPGWRAGDLRDRLQATLDLLEPLNEDEVEQFVPPRVVREDPPGTRTGLFEWIEELALLEAGPSPLEDLYQKLDRAARAFLRQSPDAGGAWELLEKLSALRGGGEAKGRALSALDPHFAEKLVTAARAIDPRVTRVAPARRGVFQVGLARSVTGAIVLQRSIQREDGLASYNFLLRPQESGWAVAWVRPEIHQPKGAGVVSSGAVFFYRTESDCEGLRLVSDAEARSGQGESVLYEGCPARVTAEGIAESRIALVDTPEPLPQDRLPLYEDMVIDPEGRRLEEESDFERALRLYEEELYAEARSLFEEVARRSEPLAPYDDADLRFNQARCLEAEGRPLEALALYRTIGDVLYQDWVDERMGLLEGAIRR